MIANSGVYKERKFDSVKQPPERYHLKSLNTFKLLSYSRPTYVDKPNVESVMIFCFDFIL